MERRIFVVADFLFAPKLPQSCSVLDVTPVWQSFEAGNEACELLLPIMQRRSWSYNKKWAPYVMHFRKVRDQRYRLDGLYKLSDLAP